MVQSAANLAKVKILIHENNYLSFYSNFFLKVYQSITCFDKYSACGVYSYACFIGASFGDGVPFELNCPKTCGTCTGKLKKRVYSNIEGD